MNITSGEIAAIVAILGTVLSGIGVTGIDPSLLSGALQGVVSLLTLGAALWSWYQHRQNAAIK